MSHTCHTCVRPKACVSEVSQSQEDTPVFHFCEVPRAFGFRDSRWTGGARGWGRGASVSGARRKVLEADGGEGGTTNQGADPAGVGDLEGPENRDPRSPSIVGLPQKGRLRLSRVDVDGTKGVQGLGKMKATGTRGAGRGQAD